MAAYAKAEQSVSFDKPETVAALLDAASFDSKVVPKLEEYVAHQAKNNKYDFEANRQLLKLYQFTPSLAKVDVITKILLKSLMALPATDFQSCAYLVADKYHETEPIKSIFTLATHLQTCQFSQFWKAADSSAKQLLSTVTGFDDAVRAFVLSTVSITYQLIAVPTLKEFLHISDDKSFDDRMTRAGWKRAAADAKSSDKTEYIAVPATEDNAIALQKEPGTAGQQQTERIRFEQVAKVLSAFS